MTDRIEPLDDQVKDHSTLVEPDHTQVGADLDLANPSHTQTVANIELADHVVEEPLKEEDHEKPNPTVRILPKEPLEESPIKEPSPLIYELEEFIKDLTSLN